MYTKTHQIAPFKKKFSGGACPQTPLAKRGALRRAIHPVNGMYIHPNIIPPMFEHGFTPLLTYKLIYNVHYSMTLHNKYVQ